MAQPIFLRFPRFLREKLLIENKNEKRLSNQIADSHFYYIIFSQQTMLPVCLWFLKTSGKACASVCTLCLFISGLYLAILILMAIHH